MFNFKDMEKFKKHLQFCEEERIETIGEIFSKNKDYLNFSKKKSVIYNQINDSLLEDMKPLLSNYEVLEAQISSLEQNFYYRQGIKDAIMLIKTLFLS